MQHTSPLAEDLRMSMSLASGKWLLISREIRSVSGAVQGEPTAYFGLGNATRVDRLVVTWPGGQTQEVQNVDMGALTIERP